MGILFCKSVYIHVCNIMVIICFLFLMVVHGGDQVICF